MRGLGVVVMALGGLSVLWVALYRVVDPPVTVLMLVERWAGRPIEREVRPLTHLGRHLPRAVIAAEDARFCWHAGFDPDAIAEAWAENRAGGRLRGASTISQQVAKNAFLWPGRTWFRKALEAWFTLWVELLWPKARIMEVYLNLAEWGPGVFGAEAAARHHFGKPARALTASEAARLAAVLPSPLARDPARPGRWTARHARRIEARMRVVARNGLDACLAV
ncbi:monofunctional biosynthetic peptidoglycan transglycosylase [Thermaurantiacus sp.]|uniref:monofunctional biosynthetic peptidoglycan transglycosylase n=1 Tax=Thermaurantiacus sp. TaxID=2820283 RepID=UPI00298ED3C0|nr:monofunctional biosynthetic peptidoglycan transglycosylase [Thermaurantiacus sp.]